MPSKTTDSECSSYPKFTLSLISLALISFPFLLWLMRCLIKSMLSQKVLSIQLLGIKATPSNL